MLSIELTEKAGLQLIGRIAKLPREEARYILLRMEAFSPDEVEELLQVCKVQPAATKQLDYFAKRRLCLAALWVLGGSWAQIGELYQVSRQTIMDGAHKVMGGRRDRLATRCTYERMAEYHAEFWRQVARDQMNLVDATPWTLAEDLVGTASDNDE